MNTATLNKNTKIFAHLVSDVFSPILIPTYGMMVALACTNLHYLPWQTRLWSLLAILFITALVPVLFISLLIKIGKVSDRSISNPRQRTAPFMLSMICYLGAAYYLMTLHAPAWLSVFYVAAAVVALLSLIITHWWKISAHTGAAGGFAAMIYWMAAHGILTVNPLITVSCAFILVGLLAWSRLYLHRHTPMQVAAGAVLSFVVTYILITIV